MDIKEKQASWAVERPLFEAEFIHSHLLPFFNFNENTGDYEIKYASLNNDSDRIFSDIEDIQLSIERLIELQEPQITELKVEWASDCFKCGHHEAIIYSTAAEASTKGWFHDGDEVKCTGCGNTGEMDARGEDSDICWNEDEAND